jgi:uncharacterized protein involved in exopolysaccharide biosynthesis
MSQSKLERLAPGVQRQPWKRYFLLGLLINAGIWGLVLGYLKKAKPTYATEWALILPGSSPGVNISLPDIGEATSSGSSPFGGPTSDPRANYQFIASSDVVIDTAAKSLNLTKEEFGKPKIKLVDNTTIMQLQITGATPQQTRNKALALHNALVQRLNILRVEEVARRDDGIQATLQAAQAKLQVAQQRLSDYKVASGLSFQGQVDNLSVNVEQLRRQQAEVLAQRQQVTTRLQHLSNSLGISPQQAASAFVLQADQAFQQNLKDYSEASATLAVLLSKWGGNHPTVIRERAKQQASQTALLQRGTELLGLPLEPQILNSLQLSTNDQGVGRASLFRDLVTAQVEQQGLTTEVQALDQQIKQLDFRLSGLAQRQSTLENLKRDVQTAEAVFASTLAKIDLGKSDIFTAYPLIQLVAEPALPETAIAPKKSLIYAGAALGSGFSSAGIALLIWRRYKRKPHLQNEPSFKEQCDETREFS